MLVTRSLAGWVALVAYLAMGAILYFSVLPGADRHWPPDFHLLGYDAASIAPFLAALADEARASYMMILRSWDPVFIFALALWLILTGWRGGWMRYAVAFLAVVYVGIDMAENIAIYSFVTAPQTDASLIEAASSLTMAKFASLYLTILVLIVHLRRAR